MIWSVHIQIIKITVWRKKSEIRKNKEGKLGRIKWENLIYLFLSRSFGAGDHGKLGHGDTARHYRPKVVDALQGLDIAKVVAGNLVSFALTKTGEILAWGSGPCLGFGSTEAISLSPQLIDDLVDNFIVDISVGDSHVLALSQVIRFVHLKQIIML